jgi:O-antigen/teichoic acid export membrane protein
MEQRRLLRDSVFNVSSSVLAALLGLIAVPLFVTRLPTADYADWIVVLATAKAILMIDFGVGWTMVYVVASEDGHLNAEIQAQLRAAATFLSALAVTVAVLVFIAGALQFGDLHGHRPALLLAGAVMAAMSHINGYTMGIVWGLRRYDLSGMIVTAEAGLQSAGVIAILLLGGDIVAVATWEATVVATAAVVKLIVAARLCPDGAFRPALKWPKAPARIIRFSIGSQISDGLASFFWDLGVLVVGQIGPSAVVSFHVAQKVPLALARFVSKAAEVSMPAASGATKADSTARATVAIAAVRIAVALSVPAAVAIWFLAGPFMTLWVHQSDEALMTMMRVAAIGVTAYAFGEGARFFLWGSGRVGTVVAIQALGALGLITAGAGLISSDHLDPVSFSILQATTVAAMSVAFGICAAYGTGLSGGAYARRIGRGLPVATTAALAVAAGLMTLWSAPSWLLVAVTGGAIAATFYGLMIAFGLEADEATALRHLVRRS